MLLVPAADGLTDHGILGLELASTLNSSRGSLCSSLRDCSHVAEFPSTKRSSQTARNFVLLHSHLLLCRSLSDSHFFSQISEGRCSLLTGGQQAFD